MKDANFTKHRKDVAGAASGIVLEIGFGTGLNLPYYKNVSKLYALDPSRELYELARNTSESISFPLEHLQASAEKIPLADDSVDTVVSTWTLCSIPRPELALKEIYRVLKPDGKFVFIEHGKSPRKLTSNIQKCITPVSKHLTGGCHLDREIDALISANGFTIQKLETFQRKSGSLLFMYKGVATKI